MESSLDAVLAPVDDSKLTGVTGALMGLPLGAAARSGSVAESRQRLPFASSLELVSLPPAVALFLARCFPSH